MYNGDFDAKLNKENSDAMFFYIANAGTNDDKGDQASFYVTGKNKLQGSNAADALTKMIDNANIDDIYTKLTFTVTEPRIDITESTSPTRVTRALVPSSPSPVRPTSQLVTRSSLKSSPPPSRQLTRPLPQSPMVPP